MRTNNRQSDGSRSAKDFVESMRTRERVIEQEIRCVFQYFLILTRFFFPDDFVAMGVVCSNTDQVRISFLLLFSFRFITSNWRFMFPLGTRCHDDTVCAETMAYCLFATPGAVVDRCWIWRSGRQLLETGCFRKI